MLADFIVVGGGVDVFNGDLVVVAVIGKFCCQCWLGIVTRSGGGDVLCNLIRHSSDVR